MYRRPGPPSRRLLATWAGAAAVLVATTALCVPGNLVTGERSAFDAVNGLPGSNVAEQAAEIIMALGTIPAALVAVGLIIGATGRLRPGLSIALSFVVVRLATEAMKRAVGRARPPDLIEVENVRSIDSGFGFPSGHTANAFVLALAIGLQFPRLRVPLLASAALVALARMYVGVHLPLDVIGGAALGLLGASVAWLANGAHPDDTEPADGSDVVGQRS